MKLIHILFLILPTISVGQSDPLALTKAIFTRDTFPELEQHITGGYNGHPNGIDLQEGTTTSFLLLSQDDQTAVVHIHLSDSTEESIDCYLHFVYDGVWKATAFRSLAMMGIPSAVKDELENMTDEKIDELINDSKSGSTPHRISSREDYDYELGNLTLMLSSDQAIIDYFEENRAEFDRIKNEILRKVGSWDESSTEVGENHADAIRQLFLSSVKTGGYEFGDVLNFSIGGMLDNTVGYLFVPEGKTVPEMNPDRIIMIREIGNGWYLYKTT